MIKLVKSFSEKKNYFFSETQKKILCEKKNVRIYLQEKITSSHVCRRKIVLEKKINCKKKYIFIGK